MSATCAEAEEMATEGAWRREEFSNDRQEDEGGEGGEGGQGWLRERMKATVSSRMETTSSSGSCRSKEKGM